MCGGNKEEKWFDKRLVWKIGEGKSTRFWHDNWISEQPLAYLFPRLFANSIK